VFIVSDSLSQYVGKLKRDVGVESLSPTSTLSCLVVCMFASSCLVVCMSASSWTVSSLYAFALKQDARLLAGAYRALFLFNSVQHHSFVGS
jgi:hypothetical protein